MENLQSCSPKDGQLRSSTAQWKEPEGYDRILLCHWLAEQSGASHVTLLDLFFHIYDRRIKKKKMAVFDERIQQDGAYEKALLPERL